jgi:alpha-tubulin suppressor-like RCC1 family protein
MRTIFKAAVMLALAGCVGDSNGTPDGGPDASTDATTPDAIASGDAAADVSTDADADAAPTCPHACGTGYACTNGHCGNDAVEISIGADVSCAVLYGGELWCWGGNTYGQMGVPPSSDQKPAQKIAGITNAAHVVAFRSNVCAANASGAVYCWGANDFSQLGHAVGTQGDAASCGSPARACNYTPTIVGGFPGGVKVTQLAMATTFTDATGVDQAEFVLARGDDGKAYCWGANGLGACAQPTTSASLSSATAVPSLTGVTDIATAYLGHACAVASGNVYCWGYNHAGQLGHAPGTSSDQSGAACYSIAACNSTPTQVSGVTNATRVSAALSASCASVASGVMCWGNSVDGELGDGKSANATVSAPVSVIAPLPSKITSVSANYVSMFAIDDTGSGWSWGDNGYGALGAGNASGPSCTNQPCNSTPQKIASLPNIVQLSQAIYFMGALTSDGKVYAWGQGSYGTGDQSCFNGVTCNPKPEPVTGLP